MKRHVETFSRSIELAVPASEAFAWHERPGALESLTPHGMRVRVLSVSDGIRSGSRVVLRVWTGPFPTTWVIEHFGYESGRVFCDRMVRGPFPFWEHRHVFRDNGDGTSRLTDEIRYALPLGVIGRFFGGWFTRRKLASLFAHRHAVTRASLGG